ncbi:MAG: YdcF family protein [Planctomycetaceae bacterium]|nr:YdcF family protein [Planctomycetaceae bacterium]
MYLLLSHLCHPFLLILLMIALVVGEMSLRRRFTRCRLLLLSSLLLVLGALSTPVAAFFAAGSLEWPFPSRDSGQSSAEAIIVLSAWVIPPDEVRTEPELDASTLYRCLKAVELYRTLGPRTIVLSGGRLPEGIDYSLADAMRRFMLTQQIPDSNLLVEDRSTTTYENAVETRSLLQERNIRKIVLVTDAMHLPRAMACFRAQGIEVVPAGCRYRSAGFQWVPLAFVPSSTSAVVVAEAAHEWIGLLWYWIRGRI